MEKQLLVLRYKDEETEFSFEDKVTFIQDKRLIADLSKPNIKNQDSSLLIKSLEDTHISDVLQIKVNIPETGYFLTSFNKANLTEEQRNHLLNDIGTIKGNETPTLETQILKIKYLIYVLNKYQPIYAAFINKGDIQIELKTLESFKVEFPLLVLEQPLKKETAKIGKPKAKKDQAEENAEPAKYEPFAIFDVDYIFALIFSLLGAFAITSSIFELMNKEGIAAFLIVLAAVFAITLVIAIHSTLYKRGKVRNPWLRYYLGIFVLVGIVIGIIAGYYICKNVLKTEIENFNYKKMIIYSIPISLVALLSSLSSCRLVNLFVRWRMKKSQ